ncbi:cytochrome P450 [Lactarius indigo]|nr:cytochrome P450 [Lactarius indigo]
MGTLHLLGFVSVPEFRGDRTTHLLVLAPFVGFILWLIARLAQRTFRTLPPGPKGLPIIGDFLHITDLDWLASPQRKDEYGEIMYIGALGRGVVVINSQRVAIDLLEKRSNIYSDRQKYICAGDFSTKNMMLSMASYGDLWRRFRRLTVEGYSKTAAQHFHPIQGREALMLALALIKGPSDLGKHLQRHTWSIMLSINYHLPPVESENDPVVVRIAKQADRLLHEIQLGSRLVEFFTWMRYIPSTFAKWKRDAEYWFVQDSLMYEGLIGKIENDMANGIDRPSFGASIIHSRSTHDLSVCEQAWLVGTTVSVGGETTANTLLWWILAMLAYPEVQIRAHAELDEVVGNARPPTISDLPSLPYIRAMDDWYEGMFIPKGTIFFQNMRTINFDPEVFGSNAMDFDPSRYLDDKGQVKTLKAGREDGHVSFGFGRRICPGRFVAEKTLAIDIATLVWAMRFERPKGARGELDLRNMVHTGVTAWHSQPRPFEYKIIPRSTEAEGLLKDTLNVYG